MRLTLALPGLLAQPSHALSSAVALERIAARCAPSAFDDLDSALLAGLDIAAAPAPLAALGAGAAIGDSWVMRADPVTMVVGHDDVRLSGRVDDLGADEARTLFDLVSSHFAPDGITWIAPRTDAWFVLLEVPASVDMTPLDAAIDRRLRDCLPAGRDAASWRRWLTEAQMLLHGHPLSERSAHGVSGFWFSGGGTLPDAARIPPLHACAAPGRAGDLLRGIARHMGYDAAPAATLEDARSHAPPDRSLAIVLPRVATEAAVAVAARAFIEPALDAVDRGDVEALALIADGAGIAACWRVERRPWLARWRSPRAPFAPPSPRT